MEGIDILHLNELATVLLEGCESVSDTEADNM
jgi:hypothetical protein